MIDKKRMRAVLFAVCMVVFAVVSAFYLKKEKAQCLGVAIIDEEDVISSLEYSRQDLSDIILFGGYPVPADTQTDTIYISQNIKRDTLYTEFDNEIASADEEVKLYFAKDENFSDIFTAMANSHQFRLFAVKGKEYMQYNVVFTNLPVISVQGEVIGQNEDERDVFEGGLHIWNPFYKTTGAYNIKSSGSQWHYRGNSNYYVDKKSIKLSLKDEEGLNADADLLGNGYEDDDWILNAMYMDDTNLREKLVMDMWNTLCENTPYNWKMTTGEYVELIKDGKYQGLYLLENRVDAKYLELREEQVLIKGQAGHESPEITDHYRIIQSIYDEELVWDTMEGLFNRDNGEYIQLDSWIDVSLFIQLGYMTDNSNRYNAFYIIDDIEDNPSIKMILWDTDLALGIGWIDGVFTRSLEVATTRQRYRKEDVSLREIYPELDSMIAQRYAQLRENTFGKDYIFKNIEELSGVITQSGAAYRDGQLWGYRCDGEDNVEYLCEYIEARLGYLDGIYGIQ
ncbi:MAG: hypothetical protein E7488_03170 [Ruminococcaceae bacterium]|nr:hypothetical protein [Oscillospiraceae bacterium]